MRSMSSGVRGLFALGVTALAALVPGCPAWEAVSECEQYATDLTNDYERCDLAVPAWVRVDAACTEDLAKLYLCHHECFSGGSCPEELLEVYDACVSNCPAP